jgi:hypothetical protein
MAAGLMQASMRWTPGACQPQVAAEQAATMPSESMYQLQRKHLDGISVSIHRSGHVSLFTVQALSRGVAKASTDTEDADCDGETRSF